MSLRKLLNKGLSHFRLELRRLPHKIKPSEDAQELFSGKNTQSFVKYHIGCGSILAKGFLNIDDAPLGNQYDFREHNIYEAKEMPGAFILKHDLSKGIPARNDFLQRIYHSHFFEHLSRDQGVQFLKDCYRSLEVGGIMRFALPDFRLWCTNYVNGKGAFFDWYRNNFLPEHEFHYHTHAQIFTGMLYNHGHQMAYDFESLSSLLTKIGFKDIAIGQWGSSLYFDELDSLESSNSERRIESLIIECRK